MFRPNEEQVAMGEAVAELLAQLDPVDPVNALVSDELNGELWRGLSDMGVPGIIIPEKYDGLGLSFGYLAVVLERAGFGVSRAPLLSSSAAAYALMSAGDESVASTWLPRLAQGSATATLAWDLTADAASVAGVEVCDGALTGTLPFVIDGCTSDLLLVLGKTPTGLSLFAVDAAAKGVTRSFMEGIDVRRGLSTIDLKNVTGQKVAVDGEIADWLEHISDWLAIAVAVEQLGTATHALELATEYVKVREQFNRPVGSFQAIKHRMSDMLVKYEMAKSAVYYAIDVVDSGETDLRETSAFARTVATESLTWISAECVQVHGGIGYTWDYPAQLFVRRAKSTEHLLRSPAKLRDQLALSLLS